MCGGAFSFMSKIQLYQGDCIELMKNIPDKSIDMILCDLPYGITQCKWDIKISFPTLWEQYKRIIKDDCAIVLFGSEPFSSELRISNPENYKYDWVWNKKACGNPLNAKIQPLKIHENIIVFNSNRYYPVITKGKMRKKGGSKKQSEIVGKTKQGYFTVNDDYYPKSIIEFSNAGRNKTHPTEKPTPLLEYLIKTYTNEGETVLDNCMGSGSTGVACINTGRNFIGMELDKKYFQISKERIEKAGVENAEP